MREGILAMLPEKFSDREDILVIGNDDVPGIKGLKSHVANLNRSAGREWIRLELRMQFSGESVGARTALVLTMMSTKHSSTSHIKDAEKNHDFVRIPHNLTVSEVKEILKVMEARRTPQVIAVPPVVGRTSFAPTPTLKPPVAQHQPEVAPVVAKPLTANSEELAKAISALQDTVLSLNEQADSVASRYQALLAGEAEDLSRVKAENDKLRLENSRLSAENGRLTQNNGHLMTENSRLSTEVGALKKAFAGLQSLIQGVKL